MRRPNILDVVRAVTAIAPNHPEVTGWWYVPAESFRLGGEVQAREGTKPVVGVVLEVGSDGPDFDVIASELSTHLWGVSVAVRAHLGPAEEARLHRLLTADGKGAGPDGGERRG